jgi:hypothetical protein
MSSESVCQVARSWVDVGSFQKRLFGVVYFAYRLSPGISGYTLVRICLQEAHKDYLSA